MNKKTTMRYNGSHKDRPLFEEIIPLLDMATSS